MKGWARLNAHGSRADLAAIRPRRRPACPAALAAAGVPGRCLPDVTADLRDSIAGDDTISASQLWPGVTFWLKQE